MKAVHSLPASIQQLVLAWNRPQVTLPKVIRWKKYWKRGSRRQDTLQHSYSIALFALWLFPRLSKYVVFDEYCVLQALLLHDIGEGEVGADTHYIDKSADGDSIECEAFFSRYGMAFELEGRQAFLLQFVGKANQMGELRLELEELAQHRSIEAKIFEAIERFDYLLYAVEQHLQRGQVKILVQTLRNQIGHFDRLCDELPGFREVLWTPELETWARSLLSRHEGQWLEKKGEK